MVLRCGTMILFLVFVGLGAVVASAAVSARHGWRGAVLLRSRPFRYGALMGGVP
jgi:hypothetical protein